MQIMKFSYFCTLHILGYCGSMETNNTGCPGNVKFLEPGKPFNFCKIETGFLKDDSQYLLIRESVNMILIATVTLFSFKSCSKRDTKDF